MAISGVGQSAQPEYGRVASGYRINSAADDAAGLAISEKENSQIKGLNKGTENAQTGQDMLNVADGAAGQIHDYLQRIRELAIQASNDLYTKTDKANIQVEIDELKKGIADVADQTTFNTKKIMDGSEDDFNIATDSNGNGMKVTTSNGTLQALGIEDFDVTKSFDLNKIDKAIDMVSSQRGAIGAQTNALQYQIDMSQYSAQNTTAAFSRTKDLDMPEAISDMKKQELLNTYQTMMQKRKQEDEENMNAMLFK
ncbi:MAG: flagellin FliC5 [Lachnospiraceae bacterium]|nr:flagellin FliC5 [Lachnospiraceae bacterium]